jgi:hypothetical protein
LYGKDGRNVFDLFIFVCLFFIYFFLKKRFLPLAPLDDDCNSQDTCTAVAGQVA